MPTAYSYIRYSTAEQAKGDSLRRQTAARERWLRQHPDVTLDATLHMTDSGRSAFDRDKDDWDTYALARFIRHIESGRVAKGSYLLVENLDRLSREDVDTALERFLSITRAGVVIVQLMPLEVEYRKPVEPMKLVMAIMELSAGNIESEKKSKRLGESWDEKRLSAATKLMTRRIPGWFKRDDKGVAVVENGKPVLDPVAHSTVRRVFSMAREGQGVQSIARKLNAENVPTLGRKALKGRKIAWSETVVYSILTSRATIGEYQPHRVKRKKRKPVGDPIPDYYPAAVTMDEYLAARAGLASRKHKGAGRRGTHINLYSGLIVDGRDGGALTYKHLKSRGSSIIPVGAKQGKNTPWTSYPADALDMGIMGALKEVTAAELGDDDTEAMRLVESLAGRKAEVESLRQKWTAQMDNPAIVDTVAAKLAELNTKSKAVSAELAEAQRVAALPIRESWGEFRSLLSVLEQDNSDEMRGKVKAVLRRCVSRVVCTFGHTARLCVALVRVELTGTKTVRQFVLVYSPGRSNAQVKRESELLVISATTAELKSKKPLVEALMATKGFKELTKDAKALGAGKAEDLAAVVLDLVKVTTV